MPTARRPARDLTFTSLIPPALALRARAGVSLAAWRTRWRTCAQMTAVVVRAGVHLVQAGTACMRIAAPVLPLVPLDLLRSPEQTLVEIDSSPLQAERFTLAQAVAPILDPSRHPATVPVDRRPAHCRDAHGNALDHLDVGSDVRTRQSRPVRGGNVHRSVV
jgi:hypothetical protein